VQEAPPPAVDDEVRRREEEELQRVLEMSMQDKGGRNQWKQYPAASSSGAGGSGSSKSAEPSAPGSSTMHVAAASSSVDDHAPPSYSAGYVPARTPPPRQQTPVVAAPEPAQVALPAIAISPQTTAPVSESVAELAAAGSVTVVTRVRALHSFEPTEPGELAFEKGEIIKVVDRGYKDWWRGQLKGRTGIFPVNYVVGISHAMHLPSLTFVCLYNSGTYARTHGCRTCQGSREGGSCVFAGCECR
jgi:signal transducing adaptor molecule